MRTRLGITLASLSVTAVAALTAGTAIASPVSGARYVGPVHVAGGATTLHANQSNNWSGYNQGLLEKGTQFHSVSGQWTVPTATQAKSGQAESSATWIGVGGGCLDAGCTTTDSTLIQAGTSQDVDASGKATYSTWYELIPAPSLSTPLAVKPGDTVNVAITETSPGLWSIRIDNATTGASWSTSLPYSSTYGTAEWIEETPVTVGTGGAGIAAMPKLGTVSFTAAAANGVPAGLVPAEELQLVAGGQVLATPSAPNSTGTAFNDCTYATSCPAPAG